MGQFGLISHRRYVDNEQPWTNVYFSDEQKHMAECRRAYIRKRKEEKMLAIFQKYYDRIKQEGIEAVNDDLETELAPVRWQPGGSPATKTEEKVAKKCHHDHKETVKLCATNLTDKYKGTDFYCILTDMCEKEKYDEVIEQVYQSDFQKRLQQTQEKINLRNETEGDSDEMTVVKESNQMSLYLDKLK